MYAQSFFVISVRGIGLEPTTAASCGLGVMGRMNAGFGARFAPVFRLLDLREPPRAEAREPALPRDALRAPPLRLDEPRLAPDLFFVVAIDDLSGWVESSGLADSGRRARGPRLPDARQ